MCYNESIYPNKVYRMKKLALFLILALTVALCGCAGNVEYAPLVATTRPVYDLTAALCAGTDLQVSLLITENISCLHDYSLSTAQMKTLENADLVILNGGGLEDFQADILQTRPQIDASVGIALIECHEDEDGHHDGHDHEHDPHFWLSPANAKIMAQNICDGLCQRYPENREIFKTNLAALEQKLDQLLSYGRQALANLSCRELITFHDGFAYLAQTFDLTILAAAEEESGSETSAKELTALIALVRERSLPAIFTETNGSDAAAGVIAAETDVAVFTLDMCMGGGNYFETMYRNIETLKEALE